MPILLEEVSIQNFRSIQSLVMRLARFTPLVGYNNSGKSNAIAAIQWLLRKSLLSEIDFHVHSMPVEVTGAVTGIDPQVVSTMLPKHQAQIKPFIANDTINIRRTQPSPTSKASDITLSVLNPTTGAWVANPTGIDNALAALLPEPIRIAAMQDAAEDSSKAKTSTTIGKLLAEFLGPVRQSHGTELAALLYEVDRRLSSEGDMRLAELLAIETQVSNRIAELFPGIGARLHFPVPAIDDLIKVGTLKLHDSSGKTREFSSYGHGTQRSVQMALVRHLADVRRSGTPSQGTTLLLIDEPELYLHPFAIEQVRVALKLLSNSGYQIVFSTHSAQLITAKDAPNALLVRKSVSGPTQVRRRLPDAIQVVVPNSTHQMEQLFTLSNSSQVLFADTAILAEGKTELRLLPTIFEMCVGETLGQRRIALVPQNGSNDTKKSMDILSAMDIPSRAIVDLDYAFRGAINDGFLTPTDSDLIALKSILVQLESAGLITLDTVRHLPCQGVTSASEAYVLLAREPTALAHIANLHVKLLARNLWLWKLGDIEEHLGLASKSEAQWAGFLMRASQNGLQSTCAHYQSIHDMISWCAT